MFHYYFEKYQCLDGEGQYDMLTVSRSVDSYKQKLEQWLREMIDFSASTSDDEPWSEKEIQQWLKSDDDSLEIYNGIRIYRHFHLQEITRCEYDVLSKFLA